MVGTGLSYQQVKDARRALCVEGPFQADRLLSGGDQVPFLLTSRQRYANKGGHLNNLACFLPNRKLLCYVWSKKLDATAYQTDRVDDEEEGFLRPEAAA